MIFTMHHIKGILIFLAITCFAACEKEPPALFSGLGKKPVYIAIDQLSDIKNLPPQPIAQTGTIFLLDSLFFMLEYKKGVHVFNLKDTADTQALTFFNIPAVTDFTVSNGRIYADSWRDLVTIDISDLFAIKEVSRNANIFEPLLFPPLYNGIFECVDENKGVLIAWEDADLENVACETTN